MNHIGPTYDEGVSCCMVSFVWREEREAVCIDVPSYLALQARAEMNKGKMRLE
jgi:hypothetical protein